LLQGNHLHWSINFSFTVPIYSSSEGGKHKISNRQPATQAFCSFKKNKNQTDKKNENIFNILCSFYAHHQVPHTLRAQTELLWIS